MSECKKQDFENIASICGADCRNCNYNGNGCKGCVESNGCPFGKKCFIYEYINIGGRDNFNSFKESLTKELNSLNIDGMPKIKDLFALNGAFVNLPYKMPNGNTVKLLDDNEIYLGNQVQCEFSDGDCKKYFGMVAATDFLLVSEYGENGADPEIILYKKR
ncbi:MAG: DUF3795 domain-containing protein [Acutalibacteraceae bacterium]